MTDDGMTVVDNEAAQQYEMHVDGLLARLVYQRSGERIVLIHTEVPDALAGRGIGSALARAALEDARARGLRVVPRCPFVRSYIERHPEYRGLVTGACIAATVSDACARLARHPIGSRRARRPRE